MTILTLTHCYRHVPTKSYRGKQFSPRWYDVKIAFETCFWQGYKWLLYHIIFKLMANTVSRHLVLHAAGCIRKRSASADYGNLSPTVRHLISHSHNYHAISHNPAQSHQPRNLLHPTPPLILFSFIVPSIFCIPLVTYIVDYLVPSDFNQNWEHAIHYMPRHALFLIMIIAFVSQGNFAYGCCSDPHFH